MKCEISFILFQKNKILDIYLDLLKLALPSDLVEHFDLVKSTGQNEVLHLYFEERNTFIKGKESIRLTPYGLHEEFTIQDFPLRGKIVYLHVRRRTWINKSTQEIVQRNFNLAGKGSFMTKEFANFLKQDSRY